MAVLNITSLSDTALFRELVDRCDPDPSTSAIPGNVRSLCDAAADRLKYFPAIHGQFTLHDEVHSLRVVVIMGLLLGQTLSTLNAIEIAILILSAYFHDQGMIATPTEMESIRKSEDWTMHEAQWAFDHSNRHELLLRLADPLISEGDRLKVSKALEELDAAMFTDFIRQRHGDRSAKFILATYADDARLKLFGQSIAEPTALVCKSHVHPSDWISATNGLRQNELVGTRQVDLALAAFVLRLADILDFDRDRTPDALYQAVDFTSNVSLTEWEKHRSISGWEISSDKISFAAQCEHPAYERAVRQFLQWINDELVAFNAWGNAIPTEFENHKLKLPTRVDGSRIGPRRDIISGQPIYKYCDLEFRLARDELVKLLMTDRLYSATGLFVRELLQNSLDALRYRQALYAVDKMTLPDLGVHFEHALDSSGFEVVRCRDNGVGMDELIVERFLTRAGRSFYRSPEFERERTRFRSAGCDFDPCARFGIGFMSCFMFGDDITIFTRRDYGHGKALGPPLVIQITGLSGIIAIRNGMESQAVGTVVEVRSRRRSFVVDNWDDRVRLVSIVDGYALATEFPITANCTVPGIVSQTTIPTHFRARPHPIECLRIEAKRLFIVKFSDHDANLAGEIRLCTLVDKQGAVVVENDEANMVVSEPKPGTNVRRSITMRDGSTTELDLTLHLGQICCDGILIAGEPGSTQHNHFLGSWSPSIGFGGAAFILDARGPMKPELTPARTPPENRFTSMDASWMRLSDSGGRVYGRLLEDVLRASLPEKPDIFWASAEAYNLRIDLLPLRTAWELITVPVMRRSGEITWRKLSEFCDASLELKSEMVRDAKSDVWSLTLDDGEIFIPDYVSKFTFEHSQINKWLFERFVLATSKFELISSTKIALSPQTPNHDFSLSEIGIGRWPDRLWLFAFSDSSVIRVTGNGGFANSLNPIVRRVRELDGVAWDLRTPLDRLLTRVVWRWPDVLSTKTAPYGSWSSHTRIEMGKYFRAIDWTRVPRAFSPPFKSMIPTHGIDTMTEDHLRSW